MVINLRCALLGETVASRAKQTENAHSAIDFELLLLVYYVRSLVLGVVSFFSICFTVTFTVQGIRWTDLRSIVHPLFILLDAKGACPGQRRCIW